MNNKKATLTTSLVNQNQINAGGISKRFDVFNYRQIAPLRQCKKCQSDYMKFSVDGFCQDCQQRCEFIMREHPRIANEIKNQRRGATV